MRALVLLGVLAAGTVSASVHTRDITDPVKKTAGLYERVRTTDSRFFIWRIQLDESGEALMTADEWVQVDSAAAISMSYVGTWTRDGPIVTLALRRVFGEVETMLDPIRARQRRPFRMTLSIEDGGIRLTSPYTNQLGAGVPGLNGNWHLAKQPDEPRPDVGARLEERFGSQQLRWVGAR